MVSVGFSDSGKTTDRGMTSSVGGAKLVVLRITSAACAQALTLNNHYILKPMGVFWGCRTSFVCKDTESMPTWLLDLFKQNDVSTC